MLIDNFSSSAVSKAEKDTKDVKDFVIDKFSVAHSHLCEL